MIGPSRAVDAALQRLRSEGERVTAARRRVLEVLDDSRGHLDAETVAARVAEREPGVHRATVYRTLQSLVTLGVVAHTHVPSGPTIYHLLLPESPTTTTDLAPGPGHGHLQCTTCQRFFDMPASWLDEVCRHARDDLGFTIAPGHAALLGTCSDCARPAD